MKELILKIYRNAAVRKAVLALLLAIAAAAGLNLAGCGRLAAKSPRVERFECQVNKWNIANNTEDGEKFYVFCPDGEFREEAEPDYALELTFFADWRSDGVSDFLTANDQQTVAFQLDHHPDIVGEHVRWAGSVKLKAPNVGGDARTTEMTYDGDADHKDKAETYRYDPSTGNLAYKQVY